jgi:hypothetical protein
MPQKEMYMTGNVFIADRKISSKASQVLKDANKQKLNYKSIFDIVHYLLS